MSERMNSAVLAAIPVPYNSLCVNNAPNVELLTFHELLL